MDCQENKDFFKEIIYIRDDFIDDPIDVNDSVQNIPNFVDSSDFEALELINSVNVVPNNPVIENHYRPLDDTVTKKPKNKKFNAKGIVPDHYILVHCTECNKTEKYFTELPKICVHCSSPALMYQCKNCNGLKQFRRIRVCKDHIRVCENVTRYSCLYCQYVGFQKASIKSHLSKKHVGFKPNYLLYKQKIPEKDKIEKKKPDSKKLGKQVEIIPNILPKSTDPNENISVYCPKCNTTKDYSSRMPRTCVDCDTLVLYQCENCNEKKKFRPLYALKLHILKCAGVQKYCCQHCNYESYQKQDVESHSAKEHSGLEQCSDEVVILEPESAAENDKDSYKQNLLCERGVVPDKYILMHCSVCNETENYVANMSNVCVNCNSELLYQCKNCSGQKEYRQLSVCEDHIRSCLNVKKYCSDHCDYIAFRKIDFERHLSEKHHSGLQQNHLKDQKIPTKDLNKIVTKNSGNDKLEKPVGIIPHENILVYCPTCRRTKKYILKMSTACAECNTPILYQCVNCDDLKRYRQLQVCKRHVLKCENVKKYYCPHCGYVALNKNYIEHHILENHQQVKPKRSKNSSKISESNAECYKKFMLATISCFKCKIAKKTYVTPFVEAPKNCTDCNSPYSYTCASCNLSSDFNTFKAHDCNGRVEFREKILETKQFKITNVTSLDQNILVHCASCNKTEKYSPETSKTCIHCLNVALLYRCKGCKIQKQYKRLRVCRDHVRNCVNVEKYCSDNFSNCNVNLNVPTLKSDARAKNKSSVQNADNVSNQFILTDESTVDPFSEEIRSDDTESSIKSESIKPEIYEVSLEVEGISHTIALEPPVKKRRTILQNCQLRNKGNNGEIKKSFENTSHELEMTNLPKLHPIGDKSEKYNVKLPTVISESIEPEVYDVSSGEEDTQISLLNGPSCSTSSTFEVHQPSMKKHKQLKKNDESASYHSEETVLSTVDPDIEMYSINSELVIRETNYEGSSEEDVSHAFVTAQSYAEASASIQSLPEEFKSSDKSLRKYKELKIKTSFSQLKKLGLQNLISTVNAKEQPKKI